MTRWRRCAPLIAISADRSFRVSVLAEWRRRTSKRRRLGVIRQICYPQSPCRISAVDARGAAARHLYADVPVLYGLVIRRQMRISLMVSLPLAPHEPSGIFVVSEAVFPEERFTDIRSRPTASVMTSVSAIPADSSSLATARISVSVNGRTSEEYLWRRLLTIWKPGLNLRPIATLCARWLRCSLTALQRVSTVLIASRSTSDISWCASARALDCSISQSAACPPATTAAYLLPTRAQNACRSLPSMVADNSMTSPIRVSRSV